MSNFTQRLNEHSSIMPSGFAGYIIRNSNVIIDKSYVQKGTTVIDAFDNSNTLIKDCCSPIPNLLSQSSRYQKLNDKLKDQIDCKQFPFWFHYILRRYHKNDYKNFADINGERIKLQVVNEQAFNSQPLSSVAKYRQQMMNSADPSDFVDAMTVQVSSLIESRLAENEINSKTIPYTVYGTYYIDNLWSSIRSVFPLNKNYKSAMDSPSLVLNLKKRYFLPTFYRDNDKTPIYIKDISGNFINAKDDYGNYIPSGDIKYIVSDSDTLVTDLRELGYQIEEGAYKDNQSHKYISRSSLSKPVYYKDEFNDLSYVPQSLRKSPDNNSLLVQFESGKYKGTDNVNGYDYFFRGVTAPTIQSVIAYGAVDKNQNQYIKNIETSINYYFKYQNSTYSLLDFIRGKIYDVNTKISYSIQHPDKMPYQQKALFSDYLKSHVTQEIQPKNRHQFVQKGKNNVFSINVDVVSSYTNLYQPDGFFQTNKYIGFKYSTSQDSKHLISGRFYGIQTDSVSSTALDFTDQFIDTYLKQKIYTSSTLAIDDVFNRQFFRYGTDEYATDYITTASGMFIDNNIFSKGTYALSSYILMALNYSLGVIPSDKELNVASSGKIETFKENQIVSSYVKPSNLTLNANNTVDILSASIQPSVKETSKKIKTISKDFSNSLTFSTLYTPSAEYDINTAAGFDSIEAINNARKIATPSIEAVNNLISKTGDIGKKYYQIADNMTQKSWRYDKSTPGSITNINDIKMSIAQKYGAQGFSYNQTTNVLSFNGTSAQFAILKQQIQANEKYCSLIDYYVKETANVVNNSITLNNLDNFTINNQYYIFKHKYSFDKNVSKIQIPQTGLSEFKKVGLVGSSFIKFKNIEISSDTGLIKINDIKEMIEESSIKSQLVNKTYINDETLCTKNQKTIIFADFLKTGNDNVYKHVNVQDETLSKYYLLVQGGYILSVYNTKNTFIQIKFIKDSSQKITSNININKLMDRIDTDIIFYYDKDCKMPMTIQEINGIYEMVYHNASYKKQYLNQNSIKLSGEIFQSAIYKPMYKYDFIEHVGYKHQQVKDWYNGNTYISCQKFLDNQNYFTITFNKFDSHEGTVTNEVIIPDNSSFSDISYINTDVLQTGSTVQVEYPIELMLRNTNTDEKDSISGLFSKSQISNTNNQQFGYKMFSFNFKIPEQGWRVLSQQMYKQNENFGHSLKTFNTSIDQLTTPSAKLSMYGISKQPLISGYFSFIYMVLNSRTVQKIVGTGNYGTGYYKAPSGSVYDPKTGQIITDLANLNQGAYTANQMSASNIQYDGVFQRELSKAYKTGYIQIPYSVKLSNNGKILNVISQNASLSFNEDISKINYDTPSSKCKTIKKVLNGIYVTDVINSVVHNIVIPKLEIIIALRYNQNDVLVSVAMVCHVISAKKNQTTALSGINYSTQNKDIVDFMTTLSGDNGDSQFKAYYNNWLKDTNNFESMKYYMRNMAILKDADQNNYPYTYIPLFSINFGNSSSICSGIATTQSTSWSLLSGFIPSFSQYKPISGGTQTIIDFNDENNMSIVGLTSDYRKSFITDFSISGELIDAEQFVMPNDMSTNLFYYKASNSDSTLVGDSYKPEFYSSDEAIIINARKMYSQIQDTDQKPANAILNLNLDKLFNTEVTLTALIKGTQDQISNYFDQVNVKVSSNLQYAQFGNNEPLGLNDKVCRYTDAKSQGLQWNLYRLAPGVVFSSENITLPLTQIRSGNQGGIIDVPVNLSLMFKDLIFQQQCRYGVQFDNVNDISFDQRIFEGNDVFSNELISGNLSGRFELKQIGKPQNDGSVMPSAYIDGKVVDYTKSKPLFMIKKPVSSLIGQNAFGGSNYYNDSYEMKINSNSVNKWKTYNQTSRFSKFLIYPDYNPTDRIIGNPYLNSCGKIKLHQNVYGNDNIICGYVDSIASIAKIATDNAYVNNISIVNEYTGKQAYPSTFDNKFIFYQDTSLIQGTQQNILGIKIHGYIDGAQFDTQIKNKGFKTFSLQDVSSKGTLSSNFYINNKSTISSMLDDNNGITTFGIYCDGYDGQKQVFLTQNASAFRIKNGSSISAIKKSIAITQNSYIKLSRSIPVSGQTDKVIFQGNVYFQLDNYVANQNGKIQIHNFKMPGPTIQKIGVTFTNDQLNNLVNGHYYLNSNDIWNPTIVLPKSFNNQFEKLNNYMTSNLLKDRRLYSSTQTGDDIKGNSTVLSNDNGEVTGLLLTLTIPGIKLFKSAGIKYFLQSKKNVLLSSQQMVNEYHSLYQHIINDYKSYIPQTDLSSLLSAQYNKQAVIGTSVVTGILTNSYNNIQTKPMSANIQVGSLNYAYNPQDNNKFQLEVITKCKGEKFNRTLYYINKPVGKWYNMAFYKYINSSKNTKQTNVDLGFVMSDVDDSSIENITSKGQEIFNCQVANNKFVHDTTVKFDLGKYNALSSALTGTLFPRNEQGKLLECMRNWKSLYSITFDKCMRTYWDCKYANDFSKITDFGTMSVDEWNYSTRKNVDLFRIGDSINNVSFVNPNCYIKLLANAELNYALSYKSNNQDLVSIYDLSDSYISGDFSSKIDSISLRKDLSKDSLEIRKRLLKYYPYKFLNADDSQNYVLIEKNEKQLHPIIKAVASQISNVMFISSPNFNYIGSSQDDLSGNTLSKSYIESIKTVNKYKSFFSNPQHRLPPVSYKRHILDSDYATLIYNNIKTENGLNDPNYLTSYQKQYTYDYSKSPRMISYVWGNSQVTKTYSITQDLLANETQLCWNKAAFKQYSAQIGSAYNFKDANTITNTVKIQTGSINERQCVLMPVVTNPLQYQKRSNQNGVINVVENIIATTALGYNEMGYPKNGILTYNEKGNVSIQSTNNNYIYIEQNGNGNDCVLGATLQKPVYVQSVITNSQSAYQKYKFLPTPNVSIINSNIAYGEYALAIVSNTTNIETFTESSIGGFISTLNNRVFYGVSDKKQLSEPVLFYDRVYRKQQLQYNYPTSGSNATITLYPDSQDNDDVGKQIVFFGNPYAIPKTNDQSGNADIEVLNVFGDLNQLDALSACTRKTFESIKCFGYDGKMLSNDYIQQHSTQIGVVPQIFNNYNNVLSGDPTLSSLNVPVIGVFFGFNNTLDSFIGNNTELYKKNIKLPITKVGVAYCDQYKQHNISGIKIRIAQENLKSAPTLIKVDLLKYNIENDKFYWENNDLLNIDITDTYETFYNYDDTGDKYIEKSFIKTSLDLSKNVFGMRFRIQQIVPQDKNYNKCIIDNIQIFTSNYLNQNGLARPVEDVYVRKADANYDDSYTFKCNEYIWRLPNTRSQWQNTLQALKNDPSFDVLNSYQQIKKGVSGIIDGSSQKKPLSAYLNTTSGFDPMYSYYIAADSINDTPIEVLSDNYLVNSNIQISWKYIDYVYIYYSSYSTNSKQLLDLYFGDKIYNSVRAKLLQNINNMNANSAFRGKYKFGGGVAVQKQFELNTKTNNQVFNWRADIRTDNLATYQDTYSTTYTKTDIYQKDIYQTDQWQSGHGRGGDLEDPRTGTLVTSTISEGQQYLAASSLNASTTYTGTNKLAESTQKTYLGSTLQNSKYISVDNWTKSFTPRQIKFKIN